MYIICTVAGEDAMVCEGDNMKENVSKDKPHQVNEVKSKNEENNLSLLVWSGHRGGRGDSSGGFGGLRAPLHPICPGGTSSVSCGGQ